MTEPGWISLKCAWCQTRFRIKEAYAHLKGKCPECGTRVPPVKTKPYEALPALSESDEPTGLVPLEDDEWPEPAQRELAGEMPIQYGLAPVTSPEAAKATTPPLVGGTIALAPEPNSAKPAPSAAVPSPKAPVEENLFQPVPTKKPPPPAAKPATAVDPLFLDDLPASATSPTNKPQPPAAPPAAKAAAPVASDVFTLVEPQPPTPAVPEPSVISPYGFKDVAPSPPPPAPPPLATFPPTGTAPPAEGAKEGKPKRKKEKPPASPGGDDPHSSSNKPTQDQESYRLTQAELNPERAVPPPDQLFIFGVWDWPFRLEGLKAWLCIALGATIYLFFQAQAVDQFSAKDQNLGFVFGAAMVALCLLTIGVFGSYASSWFLAILADTANGSRTVSSPGGTIVDWLGALLRIGWILFLAGLISIPFGILGWITWMLGVLLIFPVFLLCSLASEWSLSPWHPELVQNILKKFKLFFTMYFVSAFLFGMCGLILWGTSFTKWLCPVGGLAVAAVWLIYARLLGRFGWVVMNPEEEQKRKKKKKKRKKAPGEGEEEPPDGEGAPSNLVAAQEE
jgi:DNA-directed RNA polymerase subunit RPC12/RpoP